MSILLKKWPKKKKEISSQISGHWTETKIQWARRRNFLVETCVSVGRDISAAGSEIMWSVLFSKMNSITRIQPNLVSVASYLAHRHISPRQMPKAWSDTTSEPELAKVDVFRLKNSEFELPKENKMLVIHNEVESFFRHLLSHFPLPKLACLKYEQGDYCITN